MKNKGVIYSIIIALVSTMLLPFSISAESGALSAPFVGFNVHIMDIDAEYKYIDRGNYNINPNSGAYVSGVLNCTSPNTPTSSNPCDVYSLQLATNSPSGLHITFANMTITNTSNDEFTGTIYKRIYEVEFILDDSYVGYVNFTVGSVSYTSYVNGTSFHQNFWSDSAQSFSITITDYSLSRNSYVQWNFPPDSYLIQKYSLDNLSLTQYGNDGYSTYPVYSVKTNNYLYSGFMYGSKDYYLIFYSDGNYYSLDRIKSAFTLELVDSSSAAYISDYYKSPDTVYWANEGINMYVVHIAVPSGGGGSVRIKYAWNRDMWYMPIFFGASDTPVQTEFALKYSTSNYKLKNVYLENINILANGTTESNQSASNVDDSNSQLTDQITQYNNTETQFNNNMNSALNNINLDNNLPSAMGSKFMSSATWVRNQFIRMTNNNPFGSVLGFSLTVGIALLVLGKISK